MIREITPADQYPLKETIMAVMSEYGAVGAGFASVDPELNHLYASYSGAGAAYFVVEDTNSGAIIGGSGIKPLIGEAGVCELQRMYLRASHRGRGHGRQLLVRCLQYAKCEGYNRCYLETVSNMQEAASLYRHAGFRQLAERLGQTGHHACDVYMVKDLTPQDDRIMSCD